MMSSAPVVIAEFVQTNPKNNMLLEERIKRLLAEWKKIEAVSYFSSFSKAVFRSSLFSVKPIFHKAHRGRFSRY